jgi:transposase-like protein
VNEFWSLRSNLDCSSPEIAMDACTFDCLLSQVAALSSLQCARLVSLAKARAVKATAADIIEAAVAEKLHCPRCQGTQLYRHGAANGMQRLRCRGCGRTFNSLTGTPLAHLRQKDKWLDYLDCMLDSRTVRQAAEMVNINKIPACAGVIGF